MVFDLFYRPMIIAALLLGYAGLLSLIVPMALYRAPWVVRAPMLAIGLWRALSGSWLVSLVLAGLGMTVPWLQYEALVDLRRPVPEGSVGLLCTAVLAFAGLGLAGSIMVRAGYAVRRELVLAWRQQRSHAAGLALIGRTAPDLEAVVVQQDVPAAYCLPNPDRRRRIVVTTGAMQALSPNQLQAVLAHERAHLDGRHHLLTGIADGLARAFPGVPLFDQARGQIAMLVEMVADDAASGLFGRPATAGALVNLARASLNAPGLAAGEVAVRQRMERLLMPPAPLTMPQRAVGTAAALSAFMPPGVALSGACVPLAMLVVVGARLLQVG